MTTLVAAAAAAVPSRAGEAAQKRGCYIPANFVLAGGMGRPGGLHVAASVRTLVGRSPEAPARRLVPLPEPCPRLSRTSAGSEAGAR